MHKPRLIVLGRQGAGKGTQCGLLADLLGVPHLSTGELFRQEVAAGSCLGHQVEHYLDAGTLLPDDLVTSVVVHLLGEDEARESGYLLDGFPRTLAQTVALFDALGADAADLAIELDVPVDGVLPRLLARRVCRGCGATSTARPGDPEVLTCLDCGDEVARRKDDTDEAIRRRLDAYDEQTAPLLIWLDSRGLLVTVDGIGTVEGVHERVVEAMSWHLPVDRLIDAS